MSGTATEREARPEELAKLELSKRVHGTITEMATQILATPEYNRAAGRLFFHRSSQWGGRPTDHGVFFKLGYYQYYVDYKAEDPRFPANPRDNSTSIRLDITKYDPKLASHDNSHGKIGELHLNTWFREVEGEVIEYRGGSIHLSDKPEYVHYEDQLQGQDAFDKIPEMFGDLLPHPVKL